MIGMVYGDWNGKINVENTPGNASSLYFKFHQAAL